MSQPTGADTGTARPAARSPQQIEAEIAATRSALTGNLDDLQRRVSPASLLGAAKDKVAGLVRRDDGSLDPVRASAVAGVAVVLTLYLIRRRRL